MKARGFTLVEVVLALTILALIMSLVFGAFFSQDRVDRAVRSETEAGQAARLFLDRLLRDVNQVLAPGIKGLDQPSLAGEPLRTDKLQGHGLTLISRTGAGLGGEEGRLGPEAEPVVRILYRTEPDRTPEGTLTGLLSVVRRVESLLGKEADEEVVCRDVRSLRLVYRDGKAKESGSWTDGESLPLEVEIQLELAPLGGAPKTYALTCGPLAALAWSIEK